MNKKIVIISGLAVLLLAVVLILGFQSGWMQPQAQQSDSSSDISNILYNSTPNSASSQESSKNPPSSDSKSTFLVREYQGHIGIFRSGENTPFRELDTLVDALPEVDKQLLKHGITAETEQELQSIVEDYGS